MLVREVKKKTDRKVMVLLEDGLSFALYRREADQFGIREGADLPAEIIDRIIDDLLVKRSRLRCMNLLKASDRTTGQLKETLKRDGYPEGVIRQALEYVASFHYTDDTRYAQNYVRLMSGKKSRRQIAYELGKKGVDRDTIRAVLSDAYEDAPAREEEAIWALARKRGLDPEKADRAELERFCRYLTGKGFDFSTIRSALPDSSVGCASAQTVHGLWERGRES